MKYPTEYVVWDLETTGFSPQKCEIVEFAALMMKDGHVVGEYSAILDHGIDIPEEAANVHGITKQRCAAEGQPPALVMARAREILTEYPASVTHNGHRFDIEFLLAKIDDLSEEAMFRKKLYSTNIDTAAIFKARQLQMVQEEDEAFDQFARRVLETRAPGVKYNVRHCCEVLGISLADVTLHRALGDVVLTNAIYEKLCLDNGALIP